MNPEEYKQQNHELEKELLVILLALLMNLKTDLKLRKDIHGLISALESNVLLDVPSNAVLVTRARSIIQKASANGYKYGPGAISLKNYHKHEARLNFYMTKLDVGLRKEMLSTVLAGVYLSSNFETLQKNVLKRLGPYNSRLRMIAATEVMNASNLSSLEKAKANGVNHFIVRYLPGACSMCIVEYKGKVFNVADPKDIDKLPPLHPKCRCYPVYIQDDN